jgi:TonB-dependent SusC/RagA subfamily outer membrane receptor
MKPFLKILIFLVVVSSAGFTAYHLDDLRIDQIRSQFNFFYTKYKQQKIYLHTDKNIYLAGETVWMKAYLIDASSCLPDSVSKDIYVDIIDFNNNHIQSIILRNKNGYSYGDLPLSDTLQEGNYQLRSYTNWMRNFDNDFFFNKTISIKNPNYENVITTGRLKNIKRFNKKYLKLEQRSSFQFFPEGGYLVAGLTSKIAFKAENELGKGIHVKGYVSEKKGPLLLTFESVHEGMGVFEFTPQTGKNYIATVEYDNGKSEKVDLPEILNQGFVMSADPFSDKDIKITVQSNRPISNDVTFNEFFIVAQSNGVLLNVSKEVLKGSAIHCSVSKNLLPHGGIVQITLFDGRIEPQCERLVFVHPSEKVNINKIISPQTKEDSIVYKLKLTDSDGNPIKGNLSISVSEALDNTAHLEENILSNLLLTSDLKGRIDNPLDYFDKTNANAHQQIDLLMLTHGWRRFVWKDILANKFPPIIYAPSEGIALAGKITRDHFGIPIPDSKVILTILNSYNDRFETKTDRRGRFSFPYLDYEDTIDVKIEAFKPLGGRGLLIEIGDTVVPYISTKVYPELHNQEFDKSKLRNNNRKQRIEFNRRQKEAPEAEYQMGKIHATPNDVIHVGEDAKQYTNILQYMQGKIPGVQISGNQVLIRGISTFYGSTDPLFLFDGVPMDASSVPNLNPGDIETIEILKGPETSIYGSRGANGVIAFYSRRGEFMKRGVLEFGMLGYYKTREFYVPDYDTWKYKPTDYNIPRTIYWQPILKTDPSGTVTIRFKNNHKISKYITTIEGMSEKGEIVYYRE